MNGGRLYVWGGGWCPGRWMGSGGQMGCWMHFFEWQLVSGMLDVLLGVVASDRDTGRVILRWWLVSRTLGGFAVGDLDAGSVVWVQGRVFVWRTGGV